MELEELRKYENKKVAIANHNFKFDGVWSDSGGEWASFSENDGLFIYATLNYEGRGIPIDVSDMDGNLIDCDHYLGEVKDWQQYLQLVKFMAERIILIHETGGHT